MTKFCCLAPSNVSPHAERHMQIPGAPLGVALQDERAFLGSKLNDLDPHTYLADVLERMISGRTPVNRLDELLAWNWKAARAAMASAAA